ncbi:GNAT family N-acetyltransferase [uncultured Clostridium sp.]|uniref:GNAT family N-acetyltransferase n=1 Tax=uncultured Clostridium sp. TaxID=59620 RepID=UPI0025CDBC50|nr:GNAT family N-acetyltransferase [uncultured Clostridium sp.]
MEITLSKATISDFEEIYALQITSFKKLLEKYKDYDFSPGSEKIAQTVQRLRNPCIEYYFICLFEIHIGAIRIYKAGGVCKLKQIFILPEFQGEGYAQQTILLAEGLYPNARRWELDTIEQEARLCHLYEKMGYIKTEKVRKVTEEMNLVDYVKLT